MDVEVPGPMEPTRQKTIPTVLPPAPPTRQGGADGGHFSQSTLNLEAEENVSKKARVARNVLHNRGEDELKFDVSEDCPNAELASRSSHEGALVDGLPAQSQGWRST